MWELPLSNRRGQCYDNGANMAGKYKGVQAQILELNNYALFTPCAAHSLNLVGANAAECCPTVTTFFGTVQKLYTFMSGSPQRWEILLECIPCSLHGQSHTRWSERIDAVRPVAAHLPGILQAIESVSKFNLSPEAKVTVDGLHDYFNSFPAVIMSAIWIKVLLAIDRRNKVLQARKATIDVEVKNLDSLIDDLKLIRNSWRDILTESKRVAESMDISPSFPEKRRRKRRRFFDEPENKVIQPSTSSDETPEEIEFRQTVFYNLIDKVITGITERFTAARDINILFSFLWSYPHIDSTELKSSAQKFVSFYNTDVSEELIEECLLLKSVHSANFSEPLYSPLNLLNKIHELKLENLLPNICISLRIFCTLSVSVAEAERSFSKLNIVKNYLRSTMAQDRLQNLALLSIENELARRVNYKDVIRHFASIKARRIPFD